MNPLTHLIVASLAFLATHYVASTPLRDVLVQPWAGPTSRFIRWSPSRRSGG